MQLRCALVLAIFASIFRPFDCKCSHLPSGYCWVNCMQDIYDIICNNVTAEMIQSDINVFAKSSQLIRLYVWLSPKILRLSADIFVDVSDQIVALDVQDATNMDTFPELYNLEKLELLSIWNSPKMIDFTIELLPKSIKKLSLSLVGIQDITTDILDVEELPRLELFVLRNLTLKTWQSDSFKVFPKLKQFEITNSTIILSEKNLELPVFSTLLQSLVISRNSFTADSPAQINKFFADIVRSTRMKPGAIIDLSYNDLPVTDEVILALDNFAEASSLSLRGNPIVARSAVLTRCFNKFENLQMLDLGETGISPTAEFLSGLPNLNTLYMDRNNLNQFTKTMFIGCTAKNLTYVDMSYNYLISLPTVGYVEPLVSTLQFMSLRGNKLEILQNDLEDQAAAIGRHPVGQFKNLRRLDISDNRLKTLAGTNFMSLTSLETLNVSCNPFRKITKNMFTGLPKSLIEIDLSMCIQPPTPAPVVDSDAFSTLPPIRVLRMNSACLKRGIFSALNASAGALGNLTDLYLEDNKLTYLSQENVPHLPFLQVLSLNGNNLQSIGQHTFGNLPELRSLLLAGNRISSIGVQNFAWGRTSLQKLEVLDLSNNGIDRIDRGSFDNLSKLKSLLLGHNSFLIHGLFINGGEELIYLGIQNYNRSCLRPEFFDRLKKLRWILPDDYNLIAVNPDATLLKRDPYFLSMVKLCETGTVIIDHEDFPGLSGFAGVTIHDIGQGGPDVMRYPIMLAFTELTYCPAAPYVNQLSSLLCDKTADPTAMQND